MDFTKINELKPYDLKCNIFDVYSYDGLSMQELLCQFFTKINECIKTSNETIDLAEWLVNEGLKQEVALKLTTWLNDGTLENLINVTLFENLHNKIDNVNSKLEQTENKIKGFISITEFGAHSCNEVGYENFDNVNAIREALLYAKENNIAEVRIPSGVFLTSQIDFNNISQIKLVGYMSKYYPDNTNQRGTVLKIINNCDVAIKFSYFNVNSNSIYSMSNTIENIKIDCNKKAMNGINLNFDIHLNNVAVVNAIENGIVLESSTYPATLNNVFCAYNGKNGLLTRGTATTVYSLNNCEFSRNNGYGMFISNGANVDFNNVVCQSNKRGGVKIHYKKIDGLYYLQNMTFKNLYLENNGLLSEGEEGYDGNWSVYLYSEYTEESGYNCPRNIFFNGCSLNKSSAGKTLKINAGYNIKFENMIFNGDSIFEILNNYRVKYIEYDCPSSEMYANIFPSQSNICKKSVNSYGIKYNKLYSDSGRPQNYKFYLKDLGDWGTLYAQNVNSNIRSHNSEIIGEPLLLKTDVIRITGFKFVREGATGKIRITLIKEKIGATGNGEVVIDNEGNECKYDWNLSTEGAFFDKIINPNTITIDPGYSIGLKVESRGHSNGDNSEYVFNLLCTC